MIMQEMALLTCPFVGSSRTRLDMNGRLLLVSHRAEAYCCPFAPLTSTRKFSPLQKQPRTHWKNLNRDFTQLGAEPPIPPPPGTFFIHQLGRDRYSRRTTPDYGFGGVGCGCCCCNSVTGEEREARNTVGVFGYCFRCRRGSPAASRSNQSGSTLTFRHRFALSSSWSNFLVSLVGTSGRRWAFNGRS